MKKSLFFLPMVAIMMAACSSNETIEVNESKGYLISFRPIVKGVTRAADADLSSDATSFNVEAFNTGTTTSPYFSNVTFTNSGGTFTSATKYYWPASGSLDFYAYSPITTDVGGVQKGALSNGDYQIVKTNFRTFTITPSATVSEQVDFIYANTNNKGKGSSGEVTTLNFRHAGAKIAVKVKNSAPNLKFEISGWKLGYLDNTATFTYADASTDTQDGAQLAFSDWSENTTQSAANTYSTEFTANAIAASQSTANFLGNAGTPSSTTDESLNMILIPQTLTAATAYASAATDAKPNGSYIALKMVIKNNTTAGETVADATAAGKWAMWPIGGYSWEPGKKYTYTIDLASGGYYETNQEGTDGNLDAILEGAEIKFASVTVDSWTDQAYDVPTPTNLTELRNFINVGIDCSNSLGYYVKTDGSISKVRGDDDLGFIAYISTTPVDDSFSGSHILVLSQNKLLNQYYLPMGFGWASVGPGWDLRYVDTNIPNIKDVNRLNGFANTQAIYNLRTDAVTVPARAWTYQSKNGSAVIEGSSGWFLPSLGQWKAIYSSLGNEKIQEKLAEIECVGSYIWTSTESSNTNAWAWSYHLNEEHLYDIEKTQSCLGFPCFVY